MKRVLAMIFVLLVTSGCATITRGTNESFTINTDPPGADAKLTNGLSCTTPCSLKVKRRGDFTVKITKEGYEPVDAVITSSIDGGGAAGMAGNVLVGGIIGAGVDAGSGAMHSHKPNPLEVNLVRIEDSAVGRRTAVDSASDEPDPFDFSAAESDSTKPANEAAGESDPLSVSQE